MTLRIAVLGASGYTGGELLRILAAHPEASVVYASSRRHSGVPVYYVHPHLRGYYRGLRFGDTSLDGLLRAEPDIVFSALSHGAGLRLVAELYEHGFKVIDLSADYRLRDPQEYRRWYGFEHPYPDLLEKAVYGLPELHRDELRNTRLAAIPGCNATASILAIAPLVKFKLISDQSAIIVDVKASSSEAGSEPSRSTHHPERALAVRPYSGEGHRHAAEVEQELTLLSSRRIPVSLVPHAVPAVRGVLASAHALLADGVSRSDVTRAYVSMYAEEPFVRIVIGNPTPYPDVRYVIGSNYADVGFSIEERVSRVTGYAAIDNLVKGAAGQAVQVMNIMMGLDETLGLRAPPLRP